jgi:hypothetical protein
MAWRCIGAARNSAKDAKRFQGLYRLSWKEICALSYPVANRRC